MSTALHVDPRIRELRVTEDEIIAYVADGRTISVPLAAPVEDAADAV
jgi:hypothetical protein